jgi:hypothetical protein
MKLCRPRNGCAANRRVDAPATETQESPMTIRRLVCLTALAGLLTSGFALAEDKKDDAAKARQAIEFASSRGSVILDEWVVVMKKAMKLPINRSTVMILLQDREYTRATDRAQNRIKEEIPCTGSSGAIVASTVNNLVAIRAQPVLQYFPGFHRKIECSGGHLIAELKLG